MRENAIATCIHAAMTSRRCDGTVRQQGSNATVMHSSARRSSSRRSRESLVLLGAESGAHRAVSGPLFRPTPIFEAVHEPPRYWTSFGSIREDRGCFLADP